MAFLLVVSFSHLPAPPVAGRDRLRQARRLAAAAAEPACPAFFPSGQALHPRGLHHLAASPADETRTTDLRHVDRVHLHLQVAAFRIVDAEVLCRAPAAEFALVRPGRELPLRLTFAPEAEHVLAPMAHLGTQMAKYLSLLRAGLLRPALVIAPRVCPGLCRVRMEQAKYLRVVRRAVLSFRDAVVRRAYLLRMAKVPHLQRLPRALPLLRAGVAHPACLFHAQTAIRLTGGLPSHQALRVPVSREGRANLLDRQLRLLDPCLHPVPGYLPRARQHELVEERSWDFRS